MEMHFAILPLPAKETSIGPLENAAQQPFRQPRTWFVLKIHHTSGNRLDIPPATCR
jgi:hypothetical protein